MPVKSIAILCSSAASITSWSLTDPPGCITAVTPTLAASSIPSLVYSDYGANEWISHDVNGFVVQDYNQVSSKIDDLLNNSDLLHQVSCSTSLIAKDFDWRVIIKSWE